MGKKFYIGEVKEVLNQYYGAGYNPVNTDPKDCTWIDRRHVIDGYRLGYGYPKNGELFFETAGDKVGWRPWEGRDSEHATALILDPPRKPDPVDPDQAWKDECPLDQWRKENRDKLADWILRAVRKP